VVKLNVNDGGKTLDFIETEVLSLLTQNSAFGFPNLLASGITEDGHEFMVMTKLGPSLKMMLRKTK
jgi:hypothetical protein